MAAILALIAHITYDFLRTETYSEENVLNKSISINFNDLVLSFLAEYLLFFFVSFLILLGLKSLYFYFVYRKENKIK